MAASPTPQHTPLSGRRALVTGAGSGIGLQIARALAAAGARVLASDADAEAVRGAEGEGLLGFCADVSDEEQVAALIRQASESLGGLDVLVNNAGVAGPTGRVGEIDAQAWRSTFDVNIHGQFYAVKHAVPLLEEGEDACVINMSSAAGRLGMAGRSAYSASKWAVVGFTKTLAIELGGAGIRANAICPGAVDGPRIRGVIEDKARMLDRPVDEVTALYSGQASLERLVTAEDVAATAVFLAGPGARMITGQAIAVDGNTEKLY